MSIDRALMTEEEREIAALRAEREELYNERHAFLKEIVALKAERDGLRAALEEILHAIEALPNDGWSDGNRCKQIARDALEGK